MNNPAFSRYTLPAGKQIKKKPFGPASKETKQPAHRHTPCTPQKPAASRTLTRQEAAPYAITPAKFLKW